MDHLNKSIFIGAQKKRPGGKNDDGKKACWKKSLVCFEKHRKRPSVSFFSYTYQD